MSEPSWHTLTLPGEIDRVFMDAAMDGREGVLWVEGRSHRGRFSLPGAPAEVVFRTQLPTRARMDDRVNIVMLTSGVHYRFNARLRSRRGCTLRLDRPRSVALMERRQARRVDIADAHGMSLTVANGPTDPGVSWALVDLSTTGLGVRLPPGTAAPAGRALDAFMEIPGHKPLALKLRVRNTRQTDIDALVGLYIAEMTVQGRAILEAVIRARSGAEAA
jgi:hypothetical protein